MSQDAHPLVALTVGGDQGFSGCNSQPAGSTPAGELKAEMRSDIDSQTAAVLQAAASWQSKGEVFEQEYQQKLESILSQAIQLLPEVTKVRDEAVHILSQLQKAEGGNSLAIFEINKRLQALEGKQNQ